MAENAAAPQKVFTASGWEQIAYSRTRTLKPGASTDSTRSDAKYNAVSSLSGRGQVVWGQEAVDLAPGDAAVSVPSGEFYVVSAGAEGDFTFQIFGVELTGNEE
jgi:hypothetical protein